MGKQKKIILLGFFIALFACVSTGEKDKHEIKPAPPITNNLELAPALEAAIDHGGETLEKVKRLIKKRQEGEKAAKILAKALQEHMNEYENHQMFNAAHLYIVMPVEFDAKLFKTLIDAPKPTANQLGWQIAAMKPSRKIAQLIEDELTRAVSENDEEHLFWPQMANAVAANRLKKSYSLLRQGLMRKGNEEFAKAMAILDTEQASRDFPTYLAIASAEELRQINMSNVNPYTCIAILQHLKVHPAPLTSLGFETIFNYAVSRNNMLADLAYEVIETYLPEHTDVMAQILAKHPVWVQMAFLESSRRKSTAKTNLLLSELRKTTAEQGVADEINELKL